MVDGAGQAIENANPARPRHQLASDPDQLVGLAVSVHATWAKTRTLLAAGSVADLTTISARTAAALH